MKLRLTDMQKGRALLVLSVVLVALTMLYNIFSESGISDIEGYLGRRLYYERSISPKGLDLHPGKHWREAP